MVGVGQGEILKVAGIDPAAQGGCWRHRRNKPGGLNRPYSHVTSSSRLAWVGEVGKGPEHGTDFENGGVRGAPRALLSELDTSHTVVEERGGSCNTWERVPREGCEPRGAVEGGCTAEGMGDEMRDETRWAAVRCMGWLRGRSLCSPACFQQPAAASRRT